MAPIIGAGFKMLVVADHDSRVLARRRGKHWGNPLDTALAVSTCLNLDVEPAAVAPAVAWPPPRCPRSPWPLHPAPIGARGAEKDSIYQWLENFEKERARLVSLAGCTLMPSAPIS